MEITYKPKSLKEALEILNEKNVTVFAGGTDLSVKTRQGKGKPFNIEKPFLFISRIPEINQVYDKDGFLFIGATTVYSDLLKYYNIPEVLKEAIKVIAAPGIRNLGTIGGNICNASPAGDTLPALYCLDAKVILQSINVQKEIDIKEFVKGPGRTILEKNMLLTYIKIKKDYFNFQRFIKIGSRKAQTLSKVSVAMIGDKNKKDLRIAFGAVGPTVVRDRKKEEILIKRIFENKENINFDDFKNIYEELIRPIDDQRSTAKYRKSVALNTAFALLKEFIAG